MENSRSDWWLKIFLCLTSTIQTGEVIIRKAQCVLFVVCFTTFCLVNMKIMRTMIIQYFAVCNPFPHMVLISSSLCGSCSLSLSDFCMTLLLLPVTSLPSLCQTNYLSFSINLDISCSGKSFLTHSTSTPGEEPFRVFSDPIAHVVIVYVTVSSPSLSVRTGADSCSFLDSQRLEQG